MKKKHMNILALKQISDIEKKWNSPGNQGSKTDQWS